MVILHHYDFSNFSEKVRLALGYKQIEWGSVTIPAYAPKPDYTPLTAGYRRTPALQIGADVYCDTRLIIEQLEALFPQAPLLPLAANAHQRALCEVLVNWAESSLMRPLALYISGLHADRFAEDFHRDRAQLHGKPQPSVAQVRASALKYRAQVEIQLQWIEDLLSDGRDFVLAEGPCIADFALYEAPWFLLTIGGEAARPALPRVNEWSARVAAVGHGQVREVIAGDALEQARRAIPATLPQASAYQAPEGITVGEQVSISPFDQHSPARGELVYLDAARVVLASDSSECGRVHVHFPRLGYRLGRAVR